MSLAEQLGYQHSTPGAVRRAVQSFGSTSAGSWLFSTVAHHLDVATLKLTKGTRTMTEILSGVPILEVISIGARSGLTRSTPLVGIPADANLAVLGSGWGQAPTPGWVFNLRANPSVDVTYDNITVSVMAREAADAELQQIWTTATSIYAGYGKYPERTAHRDIAVFVLEPTSTR